MHKPDNDCNETVAFRVTEVAKKLGLGRSKVYEMTKSGELPVLKIGTAVRIPCKKFLEWVERKTSKVA
jgi:excisionase family DNA binding protein